MIDQEQIIRFQEYLMNAWPSEHYFFLNGWILKFHYGVTYRANSVFPVRYFGLNIEDDIKVVEKAYRSYNLPPIFTMHEYFKPINLDQILKKRGYKEEDYTNALIAKINYMKISDINSDFSYELHGNRVEEFSNLLASYTKRDKQQQIIINKITKRINIPEKVFIIARDSDRAIGTLMGVLNPDGYLYIADLFVSPEYRRKKVASSLIAALLKDWAKPRNTIFIWLQVEIKNKPALRFYEKLGLKIVYSYYYLRKDLS